MGAPNTKINQEYKIMSDTVIVAIIGAIAAGLPTVATIITAILQARSSRRNFAKQSILNLINEDKTEALYGNMPDNYQNVLHEYDEYSKNGGNSYVHDKVDEYKKWYAKWQAEHIDKKTQV